MIVELVGWDSTNKVWVKVLVDDEGKLHISSSALPAGAATAANQVLARALLTTIAGFTDYMTDNMGLQIRGRIGATSGPAAGSTNALLRLILAELAFGGNVYSKTMTMADNNATRFETTAKKLRDVVIIVKTHGMLLGETGVEVYPVGANEAVGFTKVDISTLYFKNASENNNGVITILGVEQ